MVHIQPFWAFADSLPEDAFTRKCGECEGTGECECCSRYCQHCGGSGIKDVDSVEIEYRYFSEVIEALRDLCHYTGKDFFVEVGDFISMCGRPGRIRNPTLH